MAIVRSAWRAITRVGAIACAVLLVGSLFASSTRAGLWVTVTVTPNEPRALEPVVVTVQTLEASGCLADRGTQATPFIGQFEPAIAAMELRAFGPGMGNATPTVEESIAFNVVRSSTDATEWSGTITFPAPGEWLLRVTVPRFTIGPAACYGYETTVTVLPASEKSNSQRHAIGVI